MPGANWNAPTTFDPAKTGIKRRDPKLNKEVAARKARDDAEQVQVASTPESAPASSKSKS